MAEPNAGKISQLEICCRSQYLLAKMLGTRSVSDIWDLLGWDPSANAQFFYISYTSLTHSLKLLLRTTFKASVFWLRPVVWGKVWSFLLGASYWHAEGCWTCTLGWYPCWFLSRFLRFYPLFHAFIPILLGWRLFPLLGVVRWPCRWGGAHLWLLLNFICIY